MANAREQSLHDVARAAAGDGEPAIATETLSGIETLTLRTSVLVAIAAAGRPGTLQEALLAVTHGEDQGERIKRLGELAPPLAAAEPQERRRLLDTALRILARRSRPALLADLEALAPVIGAVGGTRRSPTSRRSFRTSRRGSPETRVPRIWRDAL